MDPNAGQLESFKWAAMVSHGSSSSSSPSMSVQLDMTMTNGQRQTVEASPKALAQLMQKVADIRSTLI
ncbi:hypothetical protein KIPB_008271 [Kipferlia bialata]|uniref:COMM domain-containing protein n=1 Tax=Kipferlia bialata TaxID=797122 RepID=A0A9K3CZR6_9EUKA|nr:hypothetical protein KIPB_008271 [Kipferlia bialata]|eukprot:g8271.t1